MVIYIKYFVLKKEYLLTLLIEKFYLKINN